MFNIGYYKAQPAEWVRHFAGGRVAHEGTGLTFFYTTMNAQLESIGVASRDIPFVFNEVTNNFQAVTMQGQLTYRVSEPDRTATLLNFIIDPWTKAYLTDAPDRLAQRLTNLIQLETRGEIQKRTLEETLVQTEAISEAVRAKLLGDSRLAELGVTVLGVFIVSAKPTPEVARALEATYRESLLRRADEASYARRAAAVEEERKIKENELATDITLEEQRGQLIALTGENLLQEAESRGAAREQEAIHEARALELQLAAYQKLDPRALTALAMQEFGKNASKIGNLTITSEILASLLENRGLVGGPAVKAI